MSFFILCNPTKDYCFLQLFVIKRHCKISKMAESYYARHKEELKANRKSFNFKIEVGRENQDGLDRVKEALAEVRQQLGLTRGVSSAANYQLMISLLNAWFHVHKSSGNRSFLSPIQQNTTPNQSITLTSSSAHPLALPSASFSVPNSLLQPKEQLHTQAEEDDEIYLVCKSSLENLVKNLAKEKSVCRCGSSWDRSQVTVRRCTPNNHVCVMEISCQAEAPEEKHILQWHSSTIFASKYYVNMRLVKVEFITVHAGTK